MEVIRDLDIIYPEKISQVNVKVSSDMTVRNVIEELIRRHLFSGDAEDYSAILKTGTAEVLMDPNKTLAENGVAAGCKIRLCGSCSINLISDGYTVTFVHPSESKSVEVNVFRNVTMRNVFEELVSTGFLSDTSVGYVAMEIKAGISPMLDLDKTLEENGVENGAVIRIMAPLTRGVLAERELQGKIYYPTCAESADLIDLEYKE